MIVKRRRGQVFIIIIIVIIAIIFLVLLPMLSARVKSSPVVQQVFWRVGSQNVTSAIVGQEVEAHVVIKATEEYAGSIVVKVRKDLSFWFDRDYSSKTFVVNLVGDQVRELELTFLPDQASGGGLRGYFIEVDFSAKNTDWVMDNHYPPRLEASESGQDGAAPA